MDWRNIGRVFDILRSGGSESAVFVVCEMLGKIINSDSRGLINTSDNVVQSLNQEIQAINNEVSSSSPAIATETLALTQLFAFFTNFLSQTESRKFQTFTYKSICNLVATIIKAIWSDIYFPSYDSLVKYILTLLTNHEELGLLVADFMIQSVSGFGVNMGYISYRRIIMSFQSIALVPLLERVASRLFSLLQSWTTLPTNGTRLCQKYAETFYQILAYNFNISYYEFETDQDYQDDQITQVNKEITQFIHSFNTSYLPFFLFRMRIFRSKHNYFRFQFPDPIIRILAQSEFLQVLFAAANAFISENNPIGIILLRSLSRIVSCRMTYIYEDKQKRVELIQNCCQGITNIIKGINVLDDEINLEIIEYNNRMMNSLSLRKFRKTEAAGVQWIAILQEFSLYVINKTEFTVKQDVVLKLLSLWRKIIRLSVSNKVPESISSSITSFTPTLVQVFVNKCLSSGNTFFEDIKFLNYKKFCKQTKICFENLYHISSNEIESCLTVVTSIFEKTAEEYFLCLLNRASIDDNQMQLINHKICIYLSLSTQLILVSSVGVEKHSMYLQQTSTVYELIGKIVAIFFKVIEAQIAFPAEQYNLIGNEFTELSVLNFMKEYIVKTLGTMDSDDAIGTSMNINSKYFTSAQPYLKVIGFIQLAETMIAKLEKNVISQTKMVFEFSLHVIHFIFLKLKHNLSRSVFKKLPLVTRLSQLILNENVGRQLQHEQLKNRTHIYQLIAFVYMDDPFDNYFEAVHSIVSRITFNPASYTRVNTDINPFKPSTKINCFSMHFSSFKQEMLRFIYDATGLAKHIDIGMIYKVFLKKTFHLFKIIFSNNLLQNGLDMEVLVPALKLLVNVIDNRSERISTLSNQNFGFSMFKEFSVFLNGLGKMLIDYFTRDKSQASTEKCMKLVSLFWRILQKFLSSKLINFSVFGLFGDNTFKDYLKVNLDLKFLLFEQVFLYPKLTAVFISNILTISESLLESVFGLPEEKYAINLFLISKRFMERITQDNIKYGQFTTIHEDTLLHNASQVTQNLCTFCVEEVNFRMSEEVEQGVRRVLATAAPVFKEYMAFLFNISFKYVENKLFDKITSSLFTFIVFAPNIFEEVKNEHIQKHVRTQTDANVISAPLSTILKNIPLKIDPINQDKFLSNYRVIVKSINSGRNSATQAGEPFLNVVY